MELFYNGTTEFTSDTIDIANNTQSSIADLLILHQREVEVLKLVLERNIGISVVVEKELATDGFSIKTILDSDILHPIDSYNLLKRTSRTWPRIIEELKMDENIEKLNSFKKLLPNWENSRVPSALGLLNIHKYYQLKPTDLIEGRVIDKYNNVTYISATRLNVGDAKLLAEVAQDQKDIFAALEWLKLFPKLQKRYRKLAKYHDDLVNYDAETVFTQQLVTSMYPVENTFMEESRIQKLISDDAEKCPSFTGKDL